MPANSHRTDLRSRAWSRPGARAIGAGRAGGLSEAKLAEMTAPVDNQRFATAGPNLIILPPSTASLLQSLAASAMNGSVVHRAWPGSCL